MTFMELKTAPHLLIFVIVDFRYCLFWCYDWNRRLGIKKNKKQ